MRCGHLGDRGMRDSRVGSPIIVVTDDPQPDCASARKNNTESVLAFKFMVD